MEQWHGRKFIDPNNSKFFLRIERQVTWGFPQNRLALFTIRISFIPGEEIKTQPEKNKLLVAALRGMKPDILRYKGLSESVEPLVQWLETSH